ncbi:hypothetical protein M747DRAFT_40909 [Aspergillus niger ATCC 13496]|uniref:Uncharacterized protein n=1 Tax=Aspergillus niger ATCC 13496 TaxID=1353008 RepID=A0A370C0F9_ASPNG|nr:hypothetical protein M747DRAFT_40909 [Aspergillus niger ATCC 13496]
MHRNHLVSATFASASFHLLPHSPLYDDTYNHFKLESLTPSGHENSIVLHVSLMLLLKTFLFNFSGIDRSRMLTVNRTLILSSSS